MPHAQPGCRSEPESESATSSILPIDKQPHRHPELLPVRKGSCVLGNTYTRKLFKSATEDRPRESIARTVRQIELPGATPPRQRQLARYRPPDENFTMPIFEVPPCPSATKI